MGNLDCWYWVFKPAKPNLRCKSSMKLTTVIKGLKESSIKVEIGPNPGFYLETLIVTKSLF